MSRICLITGGARSGKSRYALERAMRYERRAFIATAVPFDEEMKDRIATHRRQRGDAFATVEEAIDLAAALRSTPGDVQVAVIDCLTVWLGNLAHRHGADLPGSREIETFLKALENPPCDLIIVTNEVGMGIIPDNPMARQFRDTAGSLNQKVAQLAHEVVLMMSGVPMWVKGGKTGNE